MTPEALRKQIAFLESLHGPTAETIALIERKKAELKRRERDEAAA